MYTSCTKELFWEFTICKDDIDGVDIILVPSTEYEKKPIYKRPRSPLVKDDDSDSDFTVRCPKNVAYKVV